MMATHRCPRIPPLQNPFNQHSTIHSTRCFLLFTLHRLPCAAALAALHTIRTSGAGCNQRFAPGPMVACTHRISSVAVLRGNCAGDLARPVKPKLRSSAIVFSSSPKSPGGNVLDRPDSDVVISKMNKSIKSPLYRVLLHNDSMNKREYVVKVLLKVVDGLTVDDAMHIMNEAHMRDVALVTVAAQETAEKYVAGLRRNGLTSTLEPDGGSGGGGGSGEA